MLNATINPQWAVLEVLYDQTSGYASDTLPTCPDRSLLLALEE
ncbi:Uncharacterised protein [Serratia quinivorans]|nr:Uncharacterised protein [Serratia quinivorans]CAI1976336.1 Uncharacterised protein [Serratia quinivorans]